MDPLAFSTDPLVATVQHFALGVGTIGFVMIFATKLWNWMHSEYRGR